MSRPLDSCTTFESQRSRPIDETAAFKGVQLKTTEVRVLGLSSVRARPGLGSVAPSLSQVSVGCRGEAGWEKARDIGGPWLKVFCGASCPGPAYILHSIDVQRSTFNAAVAGALYSKLHFTMSLTL